MKPVQNALIRVKECLRWATKKKGGFIKKPTLYNSHLRRLSKT